MFGFVLSAVRLSRSAVGRWGEGGVPLVCPCFGVMLLLTRWVGGGWPAPSCCGCVECGVAAVAAGLEVSLSSCVCAEPLAYLGGGDRGQVMPGVPYAGGLERAAPSAFEEWVRRSFTDTARTMKIRVAVGVDQAERHVTACRGAGLASCEPHA